MTDDYFRSLVDDLNQELDDAKMEIMKLQGRDRLMTSFLEASDREYKLLKAEVDRCHLVIEKFEIALAEEDGL